MLNFTQSFGEATGFEPTGDDVNSAVNLMILQTADLMFRTAVGAMIKTTGGPFVLAAQMAISVPLLLLSYYFMHTFRAHFSMSTRKNLITIALLMMFENGVNCLLRFFISIKFFLGDAVYL